MKTKHDIVSNWLPRYTGTPLESFGKYILLTNFFHYVELFAKRFAVELVGRDLPMQSATAERVTIMNFGSYSAEEAVGHKPRVVVLNEKNEVTRYDAGSQQEEFQVVG